MLEVVEHRVGSDFKHGMELGFGASWDIVWTPGSNIVCEPARSMEGCLFDLWLETRHELMAGGPASLPLGEGPSMKS